MLFTKYSLLVGKIRRSNERWKTTDDATNKMLEPFIVEEFLFLLLFQYVFWLLKICCLLIALLPI